MAEQLTNYQCPNCGGKMYFSNATGKLQCDFCDSSFTVEEVEAFFAAKNEKASAAFDKEDAKASAEEAKATGGAVKDKSQKNIASAEKQVKSASSKWDEATISSDWGELGDDVKSYVCPSCGGEIICDNNTAATNCPYCGNNTIVPGQLSGSLKPDYIIPFKLDKQAAIAALKKHYGKRLFLPKEFKDKNTIEKIQGIYVPFWLFDADVQIRGDFEGKRSTSHRQGDYIVTTTKHYDVTRGGHFSFDLVPADASAKMPDDLMDSIEPYDYKEMVPFSPGYLPGYLADKYDVTIAMCANRADLRFRNTASDLLKNDIHGYQSVVTRGINSNINRKKVSYALLPVWILKTKWENKDYIFAMNGQTGKLVGDLPVSKSKYWLFTLLLTIPAAALFYFLRIGDIISAFLGL